MFSPSRCRVFLFKEVSPTGDGGMHPPFSFVFPKENVPCTVEEKSALSNLDPAGSRLGMRRLLATSGINLPLFIRVRCASALGGTFQPQDAALGGNLWEANEWVFAAAPCIPLRYTLRCRSSASPSRKGASRGFSGSFASGKCRKANPFRQDMRLPKIPRLSRRGRRSPVNASLVVGQ